MATSLGTAWIQIKPSLKGVAIDIKKELATVDETALSSGKKWGSSWAVAAGSLIASGIAKAVSVVTNNLSSAISRVDTLSNFPKVMTALGYSSEEASGSVSAISNALDGLPTSLDAAVSDIQKLAATMGNLNRGTVNATSVGLALNNMFLAGGKGTEAASMALEQYNQMLASGKVDMQSWRSILNAAPGQLDQLSKTLLGTSANQQTLYKALQTGTISFDQLNEAIVKLNSEGGKNFASFEEQARSATDGIATQLQNIRTSVTKVLSAALTGEDVEKPLTQLLDRVGKIVERLAPSFVTIIGTVIETVFGKLPQLLVNMAPKAAAAIVGLIKKISENIPLYTQNLINAIIDIVNAIIPQLPQILKSVVEGIIGMILTLTAPENLSRVLETMLTLLMTIVDVLPDVLIALTDALPAMIENIVLFLTDPENILKITKAAIKLFLGIVLAVPQISNNLNDAFGQLLSNLWEKLKERFGKFAGEFGETIGQKFKDAINGVLGFIEGFINGPIDAINGFIDKINEAFGFIGVNLGKIGRVSLPRLATGGIVGGIGTDTSDSNLVALSKGEYVIRASAARQIGYDNLEKMNKDGVVEGNITQNITINGYNKDPNELADIISRKIALKTRGVY